MSNIMKIGMWVFGGIFLLTMFATCNRSKPEKVSADVIAQEYAKGLDLKLAAELAKKANNAAEFEKQLNTPGSKVNNIDLNDDGKVDYINVTEYGSGNDRGFSLTTELAAGKVQEIATIQFSKQGDRVNMNVNGNSSLYGNNSHYRSSFGLTDILLVSWLFSDMNRPHYRSSYGYGNYPSHYNNQNWKRKTNKEYQGYASSRGSRSTFKKSSTKSSSSIKSPNASKTAARASILANPTKSQRSFQTRSGKSSSSRSGGFGRSSSGSSSSSRSGSSFGGGK